MAPHKRALFALKAYGLVQRPAFKGWGRYDEIFMPTVLDSPLGLSKNLSAPTDHRKSRSLRIAMGFAKVPLGHPLGAVRLGDSHGLM
jgi:hypothetical protein